MKSTKLFPFLIIGLVGLILVACGPDPQIGFQGRLLDTASLAQVTDANGNPVNGTVSITFRIFDVSDCSDSALWTETHNNVSVTNGLFNVALGSVNGLDPQDFAQPLWLELEVEGETLSPCQKLLGSPYAMTLVGGAVIASTQIDSTHPNYPNYGVLNVNAASDGNALVLAVLDGEDTGDGQVADLIRGCDSDDGFTCADVEFRVDGMGRVFADGGYFVGASDFAEMLPAETGLTPGDVLVVGPDGKLALSNERFQSSVVGVYSTKPGFMGGYALDGAGMEGKVPLAVVGVVPVKISAENGRVQPGDLLTTSSSPGYAMRAGVNPPNGTVIGKALEPLNGLRGVILMLVILQ